MAEFPAETEVAPGRMVRCIKPFQVPERTQHVTGHSAAIAASATHALMVRDLCASYTGLQVVHNVHLHVDRGECLALVGESGSGKTTLSRSIGGLHREWTGEILLGSERLAPSARDRTTAQRLRIQYVFQNPYSSLQPRRPVGDLLPGR
jgi:peptide/nickel transport system ATP-binding protein